jgi:hypothetical protein
MRISVVPSFEQLIADYQNTAEHNDRVFRQLSELTWADRDLSAHRRHIEQNKLGFGDAAFHAMWLRLLDNANRRFGAIHALEIGVYKGQVISLWAMIGKQWNIDIRISAITPLSGQPMPRSAFVTWLRTHFDPSFREQVRNGNFYAQADYLTLISQLFERFNVNFESVCLYHGYSTDQRILERVAGSSFHIIYVDGDHTFQGAQHDFKVFGPKVVKGGWLIADDAGCSLPGSAFWKGHEAVSNAAKILPDLGFQNVLNVGHNRIYERVA